MSNPIRVRRGMTIRFSDDDTTKDHQLHTSGQPCAHSSAPIGAGFDHNGAGGRGRVCIEVVE